MAKAAKKTAKKGAKKSSSTSRTRKRTATKRTSRSATSKRSSSTSKKAAKKTARKRRTTSRGSGKREQIAPRGDKRYIRRDARGRIRESDDQSRSLSQDRKKTAKKKVRSGYGDRGDR